MLRQIGTAGNYYPRIVFVFKSSSKYYLSFLFTDFELRFHRLMVLSNSHNARQLWDNFSSRITPFIGFQAYVSIVYDTLEIFLDSQHFVEKREK